MMNNATAAAYFRCGLEAGIVSEQDVRNWALAITDSSDSQPCEVADVLNSRNFLQTIEKLSEVPGDRNLQQIGYFLLHTLSLQLQEKPETMQRIVQQALQVTYSTLLDDEITQVFDGIDDSINLAISGTYGSLAECQRDLVNAFSQYSQDHQLNMPP